ncbi:AAA family ATPase [Mycoplasma sp. SG1]|uniref:AAA family ATPase n=1 Tax=Mycoplasma sp. SG1 TaxID=2810348 RepID=UPI002024DDE1|nr:chromosome segregation SMC family protein [Mycoplasma sp. SG1]URM53237.1 chromosome segregation protein SMC [Mycoplasma sp. SG1]
MIFLKRIYIEGFKSFACKSNLYFNYPLTAIIGPNGAGKSNLIDAIRWILGDKISKQMRIKNYNDLIFNGTTKEYQPAPFATVKLYFDNSTHLFDYDLNEIVLEKTVYRDDFNADTFINRNPITQKEIVQMMSGIGIVNFGLSFISQNTINQMINYKPDEMKQLFISVSGLLQYKKNRTKIFKNLVQTDEKLKTLSLIFNKAEARFEQLQLEVQKAKKFKALKEELYQKEIWYLVNVINKQYEDFNRCQEEIDKLNLNKDLILKNKEDANWKFKTYQTEISQLEDDSLNISNDIQNLNSLIFNLQQIETIDINLDIKTIKKFLDSLKIKHSKILENIKTFSQEEQDLKTESDSLKLKFKENEYHISFLKTRTNDPNFLLKDTFPECYGYIYDLFTADEKYQTAITAVLGGKLKNILVQNEETAKKIIDYLNTNKLFKTTFLIYENIVQTNVNQEEIKQQLFQRLKIKDLILPPFVELINFEKKYLKVFQYLFRNTILTTDFDTAKHLKKLLPEFIIVTLAGDVFIKREEIIGGYIKINKQQAVINEINLLHDKNKKIQHLLDINQEKLNNLRLKINSLKTEQEEIYKEILKFEYQYNLFQKHESAQKQNNDITALKDINAYKSKLIKLNLDFKIKNQQKVKLLAAQQNNFSNLKKFEDEYNEFHRKLEKLNISALEQKITIKNFSTTLVQRYKLTIETATDLAKTFHLSDVTSQEIELIKNELSKIGSVNLDSIAIYEKEQETFHKLKTEYVNVSKTVYQIEETINTLDNILKTLFTNFIDEVNKILPEIFHKFYTDGKIFLKHVEDLETDYSGIEISATFPSKKESYFLDNLSGGEKTLVIVCILLAILKIKKLPLIIFDEVDANLDPVNASKLGSLLKEFSKEIQFILITHRNQLMVHCPVLYGATTHGKGVTNIVGINVKNE